MASSNKSSLDDVLKKIGCTTSVRQSKTRSGSMDGLEIYERSPVKASLDPELVARRYWYKSSTVFAEWCLVKHWVAR